MAKKLIAKILIFVCVALFLECNVYGISENEFTNNSIIISEDFSDYYGGKPITAQSGGNSATAKVYSDFQGTSLCWRNPNRNYSDVIQADFTGILVYKLDRPLKAEKYVLSFDFLCETAPNAGELGRLIMCKLGSSNGSMGQSFMVANGYMGFNIPMNGWEPNNQNKVKYVADKWYSIDMVIAPTGNYPTIEYFIDGNYIGENTIPSWITEIDKIEFWLEDKRSEGSMYFDNIVLSEGKIGRTLDVMSELYEGDTKINIRLPFSVDASFQADFVNDTDAISLVDSKGNRFEVDAIKQLTPNGYELQLKKPLEPGTLKCTINSSVKDILYLNGFENISVETNVYKDNINVEDLFHLGNVKYVMGNGNVTAAGMTAGTESDMPLSTNVRRGIYGRNISPEPGLKSIYFDVTDKSLTNISDGSSMLVSVVYFDSGYGKINVFYDSVYLTEEYGGSIELTDTNEWKKSTLQLPCPAFNNAISIASGNYDFYLSLYNPTVGMSDYAVLIGAVEIEKALPVSSVEINAKTGKTGNIFYTGDDINFDIKFIERFSSAQDMPSSYNGYIAVSDADGNQLWKNEITDLKFDLAPAINKKISVGSLPYGTYKLDILVSGTDKQNISSKSFDFSYVYSDKGKTNNDRMGICMHYALGEHRTLASAEELLDLYDNAGFGIVRDDFYLDQFARLNNGEWKYEMPEVWNKYIEDIQDRGMKLMPIAQGTVPGSGESPVYRPETQAQFGVIISKFAEELYSRGVDMLEVLNEYDVAAYMIPPVTYYVDGNYFEKAGYYAELLNQVYPRIKDTTPEMTVVGGVTANVPKAWIDVLFREISERSSENPLMDVLSVHPYVSYPTKSSLSDMIEENTSAMDANGYNIPVWATEFGRSTSGAEGASPKEQAEAVTRYYITAVAHNTLEKMFLYSYKDSSTDVLNIESQYGIVKPNISDVVDVPYAAKPAYLALSNMNMQLTGAEISDIVSESDNYGERCIYKFKTEDGDTLYTFWGGASDITFDVGVPRVFLYDMYGNEEVLDSESGVYALSATDGVRYLRVPDYSVPTYIVDNTSKIKIRYNTNISPALSGSDGKRIEYSKSLEDGYAFIEAAIPEDGILLMSWTEKNEVCSFIINGNIPQFLNEKSRYMISLDMKNRKVSLNGVTYKQQNNQLFVNVMAPNQNDNSMIMGESEYVDTVLTNCNGEYKLSFATGLSNGEYSIKVYNDEGVESNVMFAFADIAQLELLQGDSIIKNLIDIDTLSDLTVMGYLNSPFDYSSDNYLVFAGYNEGKLVSLIAKPLSELGIVCYANDFEATTASNYVNDEGNGVVKVDGKAILPFKDNPVKSGNIHISMKVKWKEYASNQGIDLVSADGVHNVLFGAYFDGVKYSATNHLRSEDWQPGYNGIFVPVSGQWYDIDIYMDFEKREMELYKNYELWGKVAIHDDVLTRGFAGIAIHDESGNSEYIDDLIIVDMSNEDSGKVSFSMQIKGSDVKNMDNVSLMLWESLDTLRPISKNKSIFKHSD